MIEAYLTVEEAAEVLKVDRRTITRLIKSRQLPARKVGGGKKRSFYRIPQHAIMRIQSGTK